MTKEFYATLAEGGKAETGQTQDLQVLALTNPELEPALDEAMGAPVLWLTQNIFYASVEPVCVVFKTMYQQMAEADQSELTLRLQDPLSPEAGAVEVKLTEAGLHGGDTSTVYLPWGYAQRLMEERFQSISCDSLQFYVTDNRQLQALHDWVQRLFQPVDIQGGDTLYSYALTIYDQTYWSTLATLQQNIRRSPHFVGAGDPGRSPDQLSGGAQCPAQWRRYPTHLSGGEQQRVAIARTLAIRCEIILADEKTGNLDEENTRSITDLLLRLAHEERRCVIVVTHDLSIAARADAVLELRDGRLLPTSEQS